MEKQLIALANEIAEIEEFKTDSERIMALSLAMAKIATKNIGGDWEALSKDEKEYLTMKMFTNVLPNEAKAIVTNN